METQLYTILDQPMYYPAFASKLVRLSTGRIKRWLQGYEFNYRQEKSGQVVYGTSDPVIHRKKIELPEYASFLELIDLLFVKQFLEHGFSLQKIRVALNELYRLTGENHFAHNKFFVFQKSLYVNNDNEIIDLLTGGQKAIEKFIKSLGSQLDFHSVSGFPVRWYPLGKEKQIVLDPDISFGRPTVLGTGINTETIYNMYLGENQNIKKVGFWLNLKETQTIAAIEFESDLKAA